MSQRLPRASTGIIGLDYILGGGIARSRLHLVEGSPGTGKTTIAVQFLLAGAAAGESGIYITLAETETELRDGARSHGWSIDAPVEIFELAPPESVLDQNQQQSQAAMPEEQFLILHLHELLQYLNRQGASTFLTVAQHGLLGDMRQSIDITYLADTVILLRYFEALGSIRRAISVMKKRGGQHESTIREFQIDSSGIIVGQPLKAFQGVLRGVPSYHGNPDPLLEPSA